MERINERGRDCEKKISRSYVERLHTLYEEWSRTDDRITTIDVTGRDLFLEDDFFRVVEEIEEVVGL